MSLQSKLKDSPKVQNVIKISGGTIIGQLVAIVSLPIITRIYGAQRMGIWAIILAISMLLQTVCDLGLESSIMVEKDRQYAIKLYVIVSVIGMLISLMALIIIIPYFIFFVHAKLFDGFVLSVLTAIYGFSLKQVNICYTWLNREKQYSVLMKNPIVNYVTMSVIAIVAGCLGWLQYGYYVAMVAGQLLTIVHMRRYLPKQGGLPSLADFHQVIIKYQDLVKFQTPNSLMMQMREQAPNLLIGSLLGNTALGYYSVSVKILNMPINFIAQAIGKVFYQSASELSWQGKSLSSFINRNINRAINLGIIPVLGIYAFGDMFSVIFFGQDYLVAGQILRLVSFRAFFSFISVCMLGIDVVLRKQKYALAATILQTLLCSLGVVIGALFHSLIVAIVLIVVFFIAIQLVYYSKLFNTQGISMRRHYIKMFVFFIFTFMGSLVLRGITIGILHLVWPAALNWFTIW